MTVKNNTTSISIELTATELEDLKRVNSHRRGEESLANTACEMMSQACRSMLYRYERNKSKWAETKQMKDRIRQLEDQLKEGAE